MVSSQSDCWIPVKHVDFILSEPVDLVQAGLSQRWYVFILGIQISPNHRTGRLHRSQTDLYVNGTTYRMKILKLEDCISIKNLFDNLSMTQCSCMLK